MTDIILAFDVSSTCTGYSIIRKGRFRATKTSYGTIKPEHELPIAEKLSFFRNEVYKLLDKYKPTCVAVEDVFIRKVSSVIILSRFSGVFLEVVKTSTGIEPILISTTKARSILGLENNKEKAFEFIKERYHLTDLDFKTHNDITDSIIVGLAVYKELNNGRTKSNSKGHRAKKSKSSKNSKGPKN